MPEPTERPPDFLEVVLHEVANERALVGLCAGFERGEWRSQQLAEHLIEWLPEFALGEEQRAALRTHNAVGLLREAARIVYTTDKYGKRGEFGELLLHVALRQVFNTAPAISRIFFKDAPNDTVKGFDSVHMVDGRDGLEIWLGEAKLYADGENAIAAAAESVNKHLQADYLRQEFVAIGRKVSPANPRAAEIAELLHRNRTLDAIAKRLVVPVFVGHDSAIMARHTASTREYRDELERELRSMAQSFVSLTPSVPVRVHLIVLPTNTKAKLVDALDGRLKALQRI